MTFEALTACKTTGVAARVAYQATAVTLEFVLCRDRMEVQSMPEACIIKTSRQHHFISHTCI